MFEHRTDTVHASVLITMMGMAASSVISRESLAGLAGMDTRILQSSTFELSRKVTVCT